MEQDQNTLFANYDGMLRYGHPVPVYKNECPWKAFGLFIPELDKEVDMASDLMKAMFGDTGTTADQLGTENVPSLSQVTGEVADEVTGEVTDQETRQVPDKHPTSTRQVTPQESSVLKATVNPSSISTLQQASVLRNREHFMNSVLKPLFASGLLEMSIPDKPRTFYTAYSNRVPEIRHIACGEFKASGKRHSQSGVLDAMALAVTEAGAEQNLFTA